MLFSADLTSPKVNAMAKQEPWSDNEVNLLRKWLSQGLTSSQMATRLGRSRSAVIGKIDRMGLRREVPAPDKPAISDILDLRCDKVPPWDEPSIAQALGCDVGYVESVVADYTV